jgi:hypothetical protein
MVRLSDLRTGRLYLPRNITSTHVCERMSRPQGHSAAESIISMKNSNDTIGNRARYLQNFSAPRTGGCLSVVSVMCCQVKVSASGWSLVQRSPSEFGVADCDREALIMRWLWPTRGSCTYTKTIKYFVEVTCQGFYYLLLSVFHYISNTTHILLYSKYSILFFSYCSA